MSNVVWTPEDGWHDGPEATVVVTDAGRIQSLTYTSCVTCEGPNYGQGNTCLACNGAAGIGSLRKQVAT